MFEQNLSPSQLRELEHALPCRVIDRTQLILDIFASHARTREGQLQVELAQLEYMLPRLAGEADRCHSWAAASGLADRAKPRLKLIGEKLVARFRSFATVWRRSGIFDDNNANGELRFRCRR